MNQASSKTLAALLNYKTAQHQRVQGARQKPKTIGSYTLLIAVGILVFAALLGWVAIQRMNSNEQVTIVQ